jgi:hypothetical protein
LKHIVVETEDGIESFLGKRILLMCGNYFYAGDLVGVNDTCVKLDNAKIVYETGSWGSNQYKDAQALPSPWYVSLQFVESFGQGQ